MNWLQKVRAYFYPELPPDSLRPTGMSRRHFLQAMGITTTSVYMGGTASAALWLPPKLEIDSTLYARPPGKSFMLEFFAYETVGYAALDQHGRPYKFLVTDLEEHDNGPVIDTRLQMLAKTSFVDMPFCLDDDKLNRRFYQEKHAHKKWDKQPRREPSDC